MCDNFLARSDSRADAMPAHPQSLRGAPRRPRNPAHRHSRTAPVESWAGRRLDASSRGELRPLFLHRAARVLWGLLPLTVGRRLLVPSPVTRLVLSGAV